MFGSRREEKRPASLGPTVAGTWYPGTSASLRGELERLFAEAGGPAGPAAEAASERVLALIAPHAGFVYSGSVAARGFGALRGASYDHVLLLGPSHYAAFQGAAVPAATRYRTPLGEVPLDVDALAELRERPGWREDDRPFLPEHCLEAEIPFLQHMLRPGWRLLPVLIGAGSTDDDLTNVAASLRPRVDARALIVVSSDMTHYGANFRYVPFREDVPRRIEQLDRGAVEHLLACDRPGFVRYVEQTGATICGRKAIDVLLRLLPDGCRADLAAYDTSGRMTGTWDHSVSYASVVYRASGDTPAGAGR